MTTATNLPSSGVAHAAPASQAVSPVGESRFTFAIDGDTTRTLRDWGFALGVGDGSAWTRFENWAKKHGQAVAIRADGSAVSLLCIGKRITRRTIPSANVRLVSVRDFILENHPTLSAVI